MVPVLSDDGRASLLLVARLETTPETGLPLTTRQYHALTEWLAERRLRLADLLTNSGRAQLGDMALKEIGPDRVEQLLDRNATLNRFVEQWAEAGIWIACTSDRAYPQRFNNGLGDAAPPIIYGIGSRGLLQGGGLTIVGSRRAPQDQMMMAYRLGEACASQGITVISGAAKGIDAQAMLGAIDAAGAAIGVVAEGLTTVIAPEYQDAIAHGQLTLISTCDPGSRWFPYTAMARNKLIYAMADAAVVVASSDEQGGTWAGAVEAIKRRLVPVYVNNSCSLPGNRKLIEAGGLAFPAGAELDLKQLFQRPAADGRHSQTAETLPLFPNDN